MNLKRVLCLSLAAYTLAAPGSETRISQRGARDVVALAANWRFQIDVTDLGEKEEWYRRDLDRSRWRRAVVPKAWDFFDEAMWGYEGVGWYTTTIQGELSQKD